MGLSRSIKRGLLDHLFGQSVFSPPAHFYVGLSSTMPTSIGGNVSEPADTAYGRIDTLPANWQATLDEDPVKVVNLLELQYNQASEDWLLGVSIGYIVLFDTVSAGAVLGFGQFARPKPMYQYDVMTIEVGSVYVSLL